MSESLAGLNKNTPSYSTDEVFTGKYWIDGKPIYRKTVNVGAMPNGTQSTAKFVPHNISNIGDVVSISGFAKGSTDWIPLPRTDTTYYIGIYVTATNIVLNATTDQSARSGYVTLEYTKQ